jgi:alpha-tubulin suppressor-like RCC1 family protein
MRHPLSSALSRRRPAPSRVVRVVAGAVVIAVVSVLPSPAVQADGNEVVGAPRAARALSAGARHTCALLDNGTVKCWGNNSNGQLGQGNTTNLGDDPGEMGTNLPTVPLGTGRTARAITAGGDHTCALLDDNTVKCWGNGNRGQLGHGLSTSLGNDPGEMGDALPVVPLGTGRTATTITAAGDHSCAILDNGTVKCWGEGAFGRLGQGSATPIGNMPGQMGDALPAIDLGTGRTATTISAGFRNTCALLDNGTVKCWGAGFGGVLGQGNTNSVGAIPGQMGDALPAIDLGTGRTAVAVSTGDRHTCAVLDDDTLKCWGDGMSGELALGFANTLGDGPGEMGDVLPVVALGTGRTAIGVSAGFSHTCALLDDATVKCFGFGGNGRLGQGSLADLGDGPGETGDSLPPVSLGAGRTALAVTTGNNHSCVVLDNRTVKCWGSTDSGQLGNGSSSGSIGDSAVEMGDNLAPIDLDGTVGLEPPPPPVIVRRPDALVRAGKKAFVGNNIYNTAGTNQTRTTTVKKGKKATFTVRAQNDGNTADTLRVKGTKSTKTFTITYRAGTTNITKAVVAGTYRTPSLAPGAHRDITVTIAPAKKATKNKKTTAKVTLTSSSDATKTDTVKATATRK